MSAFSPGSPPVPNPDEPLIATWKAFVEGKLEGGNPDLRITEPHDEDVLSALRPVTTAGVIAQLRYALYGVAPRRWIEWAALGCMDDRWVTERLSRDAFVDIEALWSAILALETMEAAK